tara:strand:- start:21 stop:836 length:816 start_codon:yes stop_codon:yes gene_type:complete
MPNAYDTKVLSAINQGKNKVRRALEIQNQLVAPNFIGSRLNTRSSALVNTLTSVRTGMVNRDRYHKMYQKPKVRASFSFAIDGSDSMNYRNNTPSGNYWKECISMIHALHTSCQSIGVDSTSALVMYTYGDSDVPMASTNYKPVTNIIKGLDDRWQRDHPDLLRKKRCSGGTSIVCYGESAIDMIAQSDATHRIAFFLTDGEDYEKRYMESMRLQAQAQGIKLVGIGLGVSGDRLPNGISGYSALDIAPRMMDHLEKIIKSNTGVESNDKD